MKKNRQRDKEIKSEGGWLGQRRERRGGRDMRGHSNQYLCFVRLYLSAVPCLVLLLYYYFSVCILLNTQSRSGREPGCSRHFRMLFSPVLPPLSPFCPGHFAVSDKASSEGIRREDRSPFHAFSSSYNLMLIKTSAQGLATYRHKDNTGTFSTTLHQCSKTC